jgi:succinyl-diaminopimelate desuccinylase
MPELGDNAIYKAAKAVLKIRDLDLRTNWDQLLGFPTVNVGLINGGTSINTVPDRAEFTMICDQQQLLITNLSLKC